MKSIFKGIATTLLLTLGAVVAFADEVPPPNALPLSEIVKALEDQGFGPITEVDIDNGVWEVDAVNSQGQARELKVDPLTGDIISDRPDN